MDIDEKVLQRLPWICCRTTLNSFDLVLEWSVLYTHDRYLYTWFTFLSENLLVRLGWFLWIIRKLNWVRIHPVFLYKWCIKYQRLDGVSYLRNWGNCNKSSKVKCFGKTDPSFSEDTWKVSSEELKKGLWVWFFNQLECKNVCNIRVSHALLWCKEWNSISTFLSHVNAENYENIYAELCTYYFHEVLLNIIET